MQRKSKDPNSLTIIPGVGKSITRDLQKIGIKSVPDLRDKNPEKLYQMSPTKKLTDFYNLKSNNQADYLVNYLRLPFNIS